MPPSRDDAHANPLLPQDEITAIAKKRSEFEHVLNVQGPVRYPGGKDGTFNVVCSCGRYVSPPGDSARSRRMWQAAQAHQTAKTAS